MSNKLLNLRTRDLRVIDISNYNFVEADLTGANLRKKNLFKIEKYLLHLHKNLKGNLIIVRNSITLKL